MRGSYILRALDRFFGIPILFLLGLFKKERAMPVRDPKGIGVLMSAAIGDSVLFSAVIRDLKIKFPGASVTVFTGESNREFWEMGIDFMGIDFKVIPIRILNPLMSILKIRRAGYFDIWIDTGQWQRITSIFSFFARANWKIGFRTPGQWRHAIFDYPVSHMRTIHELENFRNLVRCLGISEFSEPKLIRNSKREEGRIVIHAFAGGSRSYLKEWPNGYWVELINYLLARNKNIFLTGTRNDERRAQQIVRMTSKPYAVQVLAGRHSLTETMNEISRAECVISVNTGIMHLAAALGVRTIGIHGPTSVVRWGPIGQNSKGIQSKRKCSPCLNLGFDYGCPRNDCMKDLKPSEILSFIS